MEGYFALVLHAHLPYVRHPEHEHFLEENWLFEAMTECYLPLVRVLEGWANDGMEPQLTLTLTPTLCSMLLDPLLQRRYVEYLKRLIELAEKELFRNHFEPKLLALAEHYHGFFKAALQDYEARGRNLLAAFAALQERGLLEIITSAATHALLPLLQNHPPSLRAQILVGRDHYRACFGRDPRGIWLPECAYSPEIEPVLQEANLRWFIVEAHGLLHARPQPRYGLFAPVYTPNGIAVFGRDVDSARQVWSREAGYPGDPRYRDFYRDIGYDLDLDYLQSCLPAPPHRSFTGIKYYSITGGPGPKQVYQPDVARQAADAHAQQFLRDRTEQIRQLSRAMDRPPLVVSPYDAELFGHWWYEGPQFLDLFVRKAFYDQRTFRLVSPTTYLRAQPAQQVASPSPSSWGEGGFFEVWLNEANEWIFRGLQPAQEQMTELARSFPNASGLSERALRQAARELLLAQSSDWPFILRAGTSPEYATQRVKQHLSRFHALRGQLVSGQVDEAFLSRIEALDNIFPEVDYRYWM